MDNLSNAKKILHKLKIKEIDPNKIKKEEIIGKGRNAVVYKGSYNDKKVTIKEMGLWLDTPLIKKFSIDEIISQTGINDILISNLLSKFNHPTMQRFYGYAITPKSIIMVKELIEHDFVDFIESNKNHKLVDNLILHTLLSLNLHFQEYAIGEHHDMRLSNILVKKTNKKYITYKFKDKTFKIKTYGYIPILIDFGNSHIIKVGDDKLIIRRHTEWKKEGKLKLLVDNKGNYDINILFESIGKNEFLKYNWLLNEYKKIRNRHHMIGFTDFLNSPMIKKYIKHETYKNL